ncbi:signal transduction histidine kinase [Spirosoma lacussanchae]|uniref:sensor histidine kinase n=1 Tax=Spirosoma lacussanchae TaxID=1884249 RepID=UPI001109B98B|nr:sensor histidine kinase [Spirosoma lacussanchae]
MALPAAYTTLRLFLDGMLCMMALYALLSYFQQQKSIYWQYALYILCMVATFWIDDIGYGKVDYLPGADYRAALLETIAFVLYIRFSVLLMNIAAQDPVSYRILWVITTILIAGALLDTVLWLAGASDSLRSTLYTINRFGVAAGALLVMPRILRLRQAVVTYFIVGSLLFTSGCLLALCINFIPALFTRQIDHPFTYPITFMQLGVVGEVLCFTLGMSLRNRENEQEKIKYQAQLIEQLLENERKQQKLQRIRDDIARDLHDDVGSDLSSINLLSQAAARQLDRQPDEARSLILTIGQTSRRVVATMREIVWSLNSAQTSLESFSFRLRETASLLFDHQPTELHLDLPLDSDPTWVLPAEGRRDLFLMVKEMLHNAVRHAQASHVYVQVRQQAGVLQVRVRDDGRGFRVADRTTGNGLRSLNQRAASLSGQLHIESAPGAGTLITFQCPLTEDVVIA